MQSTANTPWSRAASTLAFIGLSAAAFAACSEGGPSELVGPVASFNHIPGQELPDSIRVCATGPAATYNFSVSSDYTGDGIAPTFPAGANFSLTNGQCATAWKSGPHQTLVGDAEEFVTITQTNQPAGTVFDKIEAFSESVAPNTTIVGTSVTLRVNFYHGGNATFFNTAHQTGFNGCTPGYWKNSKAAWPIAKNSSFNTVFGIGSAWFSNGMTLETAIDLNGGGASALARHATAALLNAAAAGVDYPLTQAQIIALVQGAYANSSLIEGNKNSLAGYNELGCPLSNNGK